LATKVEFSKYLKADTGTLYETISVIVLIGVCLLVLLVKLETYPLLWFDEGYKLNAAYTFAQDGLYATYTVNGYVPFDPGTSGGPADIIPTALALKLLGTSISAARLSRVIYTLLACIGLYQIARYLWGGVVGIFCVLLVIAMPPLNDVSLVMIGRQSLSEATALSLMVLGIWAMSHAWRTGGFLWSILSGIVMGLGMLSKSQMAIGLVPALFVVIVWRWLRDRKGARLLFAPVIMVVAVFLAWMLVGQLLTPPEISKQNSELFMDAIRTNIFTDLHGSNLDNQGRFLMGLMVIGTVTSLWRIWLAKSISEQQWIELVLVFFTAFTIIWFALFSVGWVRYAYAGSVVGIFLIGRFIWGIFGRATLSWPRLRIGLVCVLVFVAVAINFVFIGKGEVNDDVQKTANYIATSIPKGAIIETWEWELDMLSEHRQFHHPEQALLFEAIRQASHYQPITLNYDLLKTKPDYLIVGGFGTGTGIYNESMLRKYFTPIVVFGMYHIYQRNDVP